MATKRTETPSEVAKVAPGWLAKRAEEDKSLDMMRQYRIIPRLKVTQSLTDSDLKKAVGGEGVACIPGTRQVVFTRPDLDENGFHVIHAVPVYFFTEFCKWSDRRDRASQSILDRTFDPTSDLARRARDRNLREEEYPGSSDPKKPWHYRYVEHLNFACVVYGPEDHPIRGSELIVGFERGDFWIGQNFCNAILQRKVPGTTTPAPIWSQVWALSVGKNKNKNDDEWPCVRFDAPENIDDAFIKEAEAESFHAAWEQLSKDYQAKRILVDQELDDVETTVVTSDSEM